jgi:hypothetical protein
VSPKYERIERKDDRLKAQDHSMDQSKRIDGMQRHAPRDAGTGRRDFIVIV